ncbi:MTH938/NDUFAF3 family protein [Kaistia dalseonensis]|uniref:Mth938-like domain-containing protein n=1 Tax=Kaistia dalseonensis TaxID=410840 RepID=A0ABU0H3S7_9HYPH|nr:MTH938/NDUFAF3 family protein [Kaistia dalseonensis]MCX5493608.1 MTH938/NDUFAF3 family protein [Kaistia dalseonensis]MDQ0436169.1 uncharacterized protein [Kaistia dalseonensis]
MALFSRPPVEVRDQHNPLQAPVDAYGEGTFSFAGMSHAGSLLSVPSGIYGWPLASVADIDEQTLARVFAEADKIDVLVIGCGRDIGVIPAALRQALREQGIGVEVMGTGPAIRTYNILLSEARPVAAALIAFS